MNYPYRKGGGISAPPGRLMLAGRVALRCGMSVMYGIPNRVSTIVRAEIRSFVRHVRVDMRFGIPHNIDHDTKRHH